MVTDSVEPPHGAAPPLLPAVPRILLRLFTGNVLLVGIGSPLVQLLVDAWNAGAILITTLVTLSIALLLVLTAGLFMNIFRWRLLAIGAAAFTAATWFGYSTCFGLTACYGNTWFVPGFGFVPTGSASAIWLFNLVGYVGTVWLAVLETRNWNTRRVIAPAPGSEPPIAAPSLHQHAQVRPHLIPGPPSSTNATILLFLWAVPVVTAELAFLQAIHQEPFNYAAMLVIAVLPLSLLRLLHSPHLAGRLLVRAGTIALGLAAVWIGFLILIHLVGDYFRLQGHDMAAILFAVVPGMAFVGFATYRSWVAFTAELERSPPPKVTSAKIDEDDHWPDQTNWDQAAPPKP